MGVFMRLIAFLMILPGMVWATPEAGIHVEDRLIGNNANSYFVERQISFYPPTYFAHIKDTEFLELSIWDGHVRDRCVMRRVTYLIDANTDERSTKYEAFPDCDPVRRLNAANAVPPVAATSYRAHPNLQIDGDSIVFAPAHGGPSKLVAAQDYIGSRAVALSQLSPIGFPEEMQWRGPGGIDLYAASGAAKDFDEACRVAPVAQRGEEDWRFVTVICVPDYADGFGVNFILPISAASWEKARNR